MMHWKFRYAIGLKRDGRAGRWGVGAVRGTFKMGRPPGGNIPVIAVVRAPAEKRGGVGCEGERRG